MVICIIWLCLCPSFVPFLWGKRLCVRKFTGDNWKFTDHTFPTDASESHSLIILIVCWGKKGIPWSARAALFWFGVQRTKNEIRWWAVPPLKCWSGQCSVAGLGWLCSLENLFHKKWSKSTKQLLSEKHSIGITLFFLFEDECHLKYKWSLNELMIKVKASEVPLDHLTGLSYNFCQAMDMCAHYSCASRGNFF